MHIQGSKHMSITIGVLKANKLHETPPHSVDQQHGISRHRRHHHHPLDS